MGLDLSTATIRPATHLYTHRVVVDGETREVVSNLSLQDMTRLGRGVEWLARLAREYGRPVQDGAA
jgi:hypothetical protein